MHPTFVADGYLSKLANVQSLNANEEDLQAKIAEFCAECFDGIS